MTIHIIFDCNIYCVCPFSCYSNYENTSNFDVNLSFKDKQNNLEKIELFPENEELNYQLNSLIFLNEIYSVTYFIVENFVNNDIYYNYFFNTIIYNYQNFSLDERLLFIELYKLLEALKHKEITVQDFILNNNVMFEFFKDSLNRFFFNYKIRGDDLYDDFDVNIESLLKHAEIIKNFENNNSYFQSSFIFMEQVFNDSQLFNYYRHFNQTALKNNTITKELLDLIENTYNTNNLDMDEVVYENIEMNVDNYKLVLNHVLSFYDSCYSKFYDSFYTNIILNENYHFLNDFKNTNNNKIFSNEFKKYISRQHGRESSRELFNMIKHIKRDKNGFYLRDDFLDNLNLWFKLNEDYNKYKSN